MGDPAVAEVEQQQEYVVVSGKQCFPRPDGRGLTIFGPGSVVMLHPSRVARMKNGGVKLKTVFDAEVYAEKVGHEAREKALAEASKPPTSAVPAFRAHDAITVREPKGGAIPGAPTPVTRRAHRATGRPRGRQPMSAQPSSE